MDRLDGVDLLVRLGSRPWLVWSVARTLGQLHAHLHEVTVRDELPPLRQEMRSRLDSKLVPEQVA